MKYYAEYYEVKPDGRRGRALGSAATYRLDGRLSIDNMFREARIHAWRHQIVHKSWTSFRIIKTKDIGEEPANATPVVEIGNSGGLL